MRNLHIATKSSPCSPQPEEAQAQKQRPNTAKNYNSPGSLVGREVWGRVDTCVCMAESLCCSLETITTLLIGYQFSHSVVSNLLRPHESQHARPPCPSPTHGVNSNSRPSSRLCHPGISSSVTSFSSCPQSLAESGSFPMSQLFA